MQEPEQMLPPSKKWNLDFQTLVAVAVVIISFCALFVSMRQAGIMNKQTEILIQQTKASSWPRLELQLNRSFEENISQYLIAVSNKGTGPAIIEGVRVLYDNVPVVNWGDFYTLAAPPDTIPDVHTNGIISNRVISAGEGVEILDLSENPLLMQWIYERGNSITFEICYKSVFDEYWMVRRQGFQTNLEKTEFIKVEACTFKPEELFIQ